MVLKWNGAGIVVEIGGFTVSEEGGTILWSFQIQGARLIAHTRDRGVRNEITLPKAMITIQSTNLTSINTMNLTYNCVLTYIWIYSHLSSVIMPFLLCPNTNCSVTHWSRWTLYAGIEKRRMKLAVESPPSFQHSFTLPWLELGILRLQMHSYLCWTCSWICNLGKTELEETNGVYER